MYFLPINFSNIICVVGIIFIIHVLIHTLSDLISFLRAYVLASRGIGRLNLLQYGSWAVITGASQGIGREYSIEMARRGLNVVVMSRSKEKLWKVADEIENKYGRKCLVIPVDFSQDYNIYEGISEKLKDLDIAILVNNVGIATDYPDYFTDLSANAMYRVVQINCQAATQMAHMVIPGMLQRGKGVIVNMSSATSLNPLPQSVVYSATKVFLNCFSEELRKKYKPNGIIVQNVRPFFVATPGTGFVDSTFFIADARQYVRSLAATIGIQENTFGCPSHAIQGYLSSIVPTFISDIIVKHASNALREKWLKTNTNKIHLNR